MNIATRIKRLYTSFTRAYARRLGDKPADSIYRYLCSLKFLNDNRYWPHIKNPRSFNEKIFHRMLFDRDPQWTLLSDKLRAREYVASKLGSDFLVPLLWSGPNPENIPFDKLPTKFVIKTNHGCGYNIIVTDKKQLNKTDAIRQLNEWLATNFTYNTFIGTSWAYKNIKPEILVEEFLDDNGRPPLDYKFFCYSARAEFLLMTIERHEDPSEKHFTRDFVPLDLWNGCRQYPKSIAKPANYEKMVQVWSCPSRSGCPVAQQPAHGHQLPHVIGRVVRGEDDLAKEGLPRSGRDLPQQVAPLVQGQPL